MCLSDAAKSPSQLDCGFSPLLAAGGDWEQRIHRVNDKQKKCITQNFLLQIHIGSKRSGRQEMALPPDTPMQTEAGSTNKVAEL